MNVTFIFKWGYDPDDAYISPSGEFKWKRERLIANDDESAAAASARKLAESTNGTLTAVTIGNGDTAWAAARGASRTVLAESLKPEADEAHQAYELAEAAKKAGEADIVVISDSIDQAGVAPTLAAMLDMPYIANLRDFEIDQTDPQFILGHRVTEKGVVSFRFKTPALISIRAITTEKEIPSMKQVLAAKRAPVDKISVPIKEQSSFTVERIRETETQYARFFEGDPQSATRELVAELRAKNIL